MLDTNTSAETVSHPCPLGTSKGKSSVSSGGVKVPLMAMVFTSPLPSAFLPSSTALTALATSSIASSTVATVPIPIAFPFFFIFSYHLPIFLGIYIAPLLGASLLRLFAPSWIRTTQGTSFIFSCFFLPFPYIDLPLSLHPSLLEMQPHYYP
nr:hypothetical membrane protein [uncultured archaeon]